MIYFYDVMLNNLNGSVNINNCNSPKNNSKKKKNKSHIISSFNKQTFTIVFFFSLPFHFLYKKCWKKRKKKCYPLRTERKKHESFQEMNLIFLPCDSLYIHTHCVLLLHSSFRSDIIQWEKTPNAIETHEYSLSLNATAGVAVSRWTKKKRNYF